MQYVVQFGEGIVMGAIGASAFVAIAVWLERRKARRNSESELE